MGFIITTDTHLAHQNIMDFCGRPKAFEEQIIENLEQKASSTHILIHLGDVAWKEDRFWNRQITSMPYKKKWLIKGNHDKKSYEWYITNGWDFVGEELMLHYDGYNILFSHKPISLRRPIRFMSPDINIHGHFHNTNIEEKVKKLDPDLYEAYQEPGHILLILEHHYTPFNLNNILHNFKKGKYNEII